MLILLFLSFLFAQEPTETIDGAKKSIQSYWSGISYLATVFTQKNPDNSTWTGDLYIDRKNGVILIQCYSNGKVIQTIHNIENDKPSAFLTIIHHLDGTESKIDVRETPLGILLKDPIDWSAFDFQKVEKINGRYRIILKLNDVGVTLFFMPLGRGIGVLSGWEVCSPNGEKTTINFDMGKLSINDPMFYKNHPFYKKQLEKIIGSTSN